MGSVDGVRWGLKPVVWLSSLAPAGWLMAGIVRGDLGADPVKTLTHTTGLTALIMLLVTLANTPIRRLTGVGALVRLRRLTGLFAFAYATAHLAIYALFDHRLSVPDIAADIVEHPWVLVGFAAFLILLALAVTSPTSVLRRLGAARWQRLHRLVYLAGVLAILHFYWLVKADVREPVIYGAVLVALLWARWVGRQRKNRPPGPKAVAERIPGH